MELPGTWYSYSQLFSMNSHTAFTAMKMGDSTAYENGQVTLNPFPHIKREPLGTVAVPIISFLLGGWMIGWASTPYNYEWAYENPKKSAAMACCRSYFKFYTASVLCRNNPHRYICRIILCTGNSYNFKYS